MSQVSDLKASFLALDEPDFISLAAAVGVPEAVVNIADLAAARACAWTAIIDDPEAQSLVENLLGGGRFDPVRVAELALQRVQEQGSPLPPTRPALSTPARPAPLATPRPPEEKPDSGVDLRRLYGTSFREGSMR